jgi:uncharacterized protein DUF3800
VYVCYIDESGTPDVPGNTSHFVLAGISLPIWHWRDADRDVSRVMVNYGLEGEELHTGWLLRPYREQSLIPKFEKMSWRERRVASIQHRNAELLRLQKSPRLAAQYRQTKKNYQKSAGYVHLTRDQRRSLVQEVADAVGDWGYARLFAECIDKVYFDPSRTKRTISEQAFEQVISRFEQYLQHIDQGTGQSTYGLLVHDNNATVARKHTQLMREFYAKGTLWTDVEKTIETPMFVDSRLTSMVQVADLCSYALRRFVENGETNLFDRVFPRADIFNNRVVGVRHYSNQMCKCAICAAHRNRVA